MGWVDPSVGLGRVGSRFVSFWWVRLGCVHYSKNAFKNLKGLYLCIKTRFDKIWLHQAVKFVSFIWLGRGGSKFFHLGWIGSVGCGLDRVAQNEPTDSGLQS